MSESTVSPSTISSSDYAQFLAQLDDAAFWEHAVTLSCSTSQMLPPTLELLLCTSETSSYLLPLSYLREILSAPRESTILPEHPPFMLGLIAWRGEIVPVLDLCSFLLDHSPQWRREDTLLITEYDHSFIGWLVPMVKTVPVSFLETEIEFPSQEAWLGSVSPSLISRMYTTLPLLNLEKMIQEAVQQISAVTADE